MSDPTSSVLAARPPRYPRAVTILAVAMLFWMAVPAVAASPCPAVGPCGGAPTATNRFAIQFGNTAVPTPTMAYHCGSATNCTQSSTAITALWMSTAARISDTTGGCIFSSNGGANRCKVGQDGLPVELLQFGVE